MSDLLLVDHPEALLSMVLSSASLVPRGLLCKTDVLALQIKQTLVLPPKWTLSLLSKASQEVLFDSVEQ